MHYYYNVKDCKIYEMEPGSSLCPLIAIAETPERASQIVDALKFVAATKAMADAAKRITK